MKKNVHPKYQQVLFVDSATGHRFVCGSTVQSEHTEKFEGKEYPVVPVATSSASHPFFTGSKQFVDAEGRVEKFNKRFKGLGKKGEEEGKEQKEDQKEQKENQKEQGFKSTKTEPAKKAARKK